MGQLKLAHGEGRSACEGEEGHEAPAGGAVFFRRRERLFLRQIADNKDLPAQATSECIMRSFLPISSAYRLAFCHGMNRINKEGRDRDV